MTASTRNPAIRIFGALVFLGVLTVLLFPSLLMGFRLPAAGSIADRDFRASQDFVFKRENPEKARAMTEAEEAVRPIYRHDADLGETKSRALARIFREARRAIQDHDDRVANVEAQRGADLGELAGEEAKLRERLNELDALSPVEPSREGGAEGSGAPDGPAPDGAGLDGAAEQAVPEIVDVPDVGAELRAMQQDVNAQLRAIDSRRQATDREAEIKIESAEAELRQEIARAEQELRRQLPVDSALRFDTSGFQVLEDDRFSVSSEDTLQEVVETVLTRRVVRDIERLEGRLHEGIRVLGDDRNYSAKDVDLFWELGTARQRAAEMMRERMAQSDAGISIRLQAVLAQLAALLVEENFAFDAAQTADAKEKARSAVPTEITDVYLKGQNIIESGQRATERHVAILRQMQLGQTESRGGFVFAGIAGLLLCIFGLVTWIGWEWRDRIHLQQRDVLLFAAVTVVQLGLLRLAMAITEGVLTVWQSVPPLAFYYAMPVAMGSMLMRLFNGVAPAIAFAVVQTLLVGVLFQGGIARDYVWPLPLVMALYTILSAVAGAFFMREVRQRTSLLLAGVKAGAVNLVFVFCVHLIGGGAIDFDLALLCGGGMMGGVLGYFAIIALTPVLELALGYATDIKLLELANMNQPALKELAMRAPGTYHHSIMVGNLAEAAAETIGANPLMTRVGAYYHDLGKMRNPKYFAENQRGDNPHNRVKPHMSALIIKSHVKDGIEIARKYRLPQDIVDFVPQHHGSALIGFFYARAKEQAAAHGESVDESDFRYPGPKPQRKETALVMLADGVEASARSLSDPNPASLKGLVKKIVNGKFIDGQLDECALTIRDLHAIVESFNRMLISIYHGRPEYPPIPGEAERARDRIGMDAPSEAEAASLASGEDGAAPQHSSRSRSSKRGKSDSRTDLKAHPKADPKADSQGDPKGDSKAAPETDPAARRGA